ncbi:MAG: tyrosine-type recombinase/integrase [Flammeovirgaceae bacterium]|nr:tyrosine-type recombinase/integrase [Flammeovirgaceae bacterium]MDW8287519.1 tyrosine-type recombinase/integrase [Flammeovirgaceae bacterium]
MLSLHSFTNYLQYEKRTSPHTITAYVCDLKQFETYLKISESSLEIAQTADVKAWIMTLIASKIEPRSVNRKIASLRAFYKYLQVCKIREDNPTEKVKTLKTSKKLPIYIKTDEIEKLLTKPYFDNSKNSVLEKCIVELLYATGIRLSELLTLKVKDIDFVNYTIKVFGKRRKERVVPIWKEVAVLLQTYLKIRPESRYEWLFLTSKGNPLYPMYVQRIVRKYLSMVSNTERQSPHVLRHTYASHLLGEGADLNAIKELLGHSSLASTQVYTHTSLEKIRKIYRNAHPRCKA